MKRATGLYLMIITLLSITSFPASAQEQGTKTTRTSPSVHTHRLGYSGGKFLAKLSV